MMTSYLSPLSDGFAGHLQIKGDWFDVKMIVDEVVVPQRSL